MIDAERWDGWAWTNNADYFPHWVVLPHLTVWPEFVMRAAKGAYDVIGEKFERNWLAYHADAGTEAV